MNVWELISYLNSNQKVKLLYEHYVDKAHCDTWELFEGKAEDVTILMFDTFEGNYPSLVRIETQDDVLVIYYF